MEKKTILIVALIVLLTGCRTPPTPPLTESEIPWRMVPGEYQDDKGNIHVVETNKPRWSVDEAYLYKAVKEAGKEDKDSFLITVKKNWKPITLTAGVLLAFSIIYRIIKRILPK